MQFGKKLTCREDNNKLRRSKQHIRREAYAYIPLTMDGEKWLAYRFGGVSSGAYPVASNWQYLHRVLKSDHTILAIVRDRPTAGHPLWAMPRGDTGISCGLPVFRTNATFDAKDAAAFVLYFLCWSQRNSYGSELVLPSGGAWQDGPLQKLADSDWPGYKTARQFLECKKACKAARIMLSFSKKETAELWRAAFELDPIKTANKVTWLAICYHGDHFLRVAEGEFLILVALYISCSLHCAFTLRRYPSRQRCSVSSFASRDQVACRFYAAI